MPDLPKKLQSKLAGRAVDNALRKLHVNSGLIDFSSNDYLGFSRNEVIRASTLRLLSESGQVQNGATGSRLLSGNHPLYEKLEAELSGFFDVESALVFNSGYDANIGFFSAVPQRGDTVFYDEFIHASIRDGIKMGNAKSYKFKHNDIEDLGEKCQTELCRGPTDAQIYIVTESVFSMDGDSPDLKSFAEYCSANNYHLVVDEAHAIGIFGKNGTGLVRELGIQDQVFAHIITFGKAVGCHGAAVLGSKSLIDYLINFARSFIYTTALPPHSVAAIIASQEIMVSDFGSEQLGKLRQNIDHFNSQLNTLDLEFNFIPSDSAIHSCIIPGNRKVKIVAEGLQQNGFNVKPVLAPTVPEDQERLRFCLHSYNTEQEISDCLTILAKFI